MNEPFLLSNLIDLQDIDNEITKLIKKKSEGDTVLELKKLEQKYKEITKAIEISKEAMEDYFNEKKDFDKKLLENENKLSSIEMKLQKLLKSQKKQWKIILMKKKILIKSF
jgi:predicted  nucleic acid-binding Zn-ribbon protein